jgi:lysozyme family protein
MAINRAFEKAFNYLMLEEAGFEDTPDHPGGVSNYGINQTDWGAYLDKKATREDVMLIRRQGAKSFYMAQYWKRFYLHDLDPAVATACLDMLVTLKPIKGAKLIQMTAKIKPTGILSQKCVQSIKTIAPNDFIEDLAANAMQYFQALMTLDSRLAPHTKNLKTRAERLLTLCDNFDA